LLGADFTVLPGDGLDRAAVLAGEADDRVVLDEGLFVATLAAGHKVPVLTGLTGFDCCERGDVQLSARS
jgi:hypothetical protein